MLPDITVGEHFLYPFVCEIDNGDLKSELGADCVHWVKGDRIGTFAGGLNNNGGDVTVGTPCTFMVKTNNALAPGDKVYAYAPYSSTAGSDASSVTLSVPPVQKMVGGVFQSDALPLAAIPYTVPSGGLVNSAMRFRNLASLVELRLYTEGATGVSETVKAVSFTSDSDICGDCVVDLTSSSSALTVVKGFRKVTTMLEGTPTVLPENGYVSCFISLVPGTYSGTFEVLTDKAVYNLDASALQYSMNGWKPLTFKLGKAARYANTGAFSLRQLKISDDPSSGAERIGNSYILQTSAGSVIVIDGGYAQDCGKLHDYLVNCYGGNKVDHWFITHPHSDHMNCLLSFLSGENKTIRPVIGTIYYSRCGDDIKEVEGAAQITSFNNHMDSWQGNTMAFDRPGAVLNIDGVNIKVLATAALRDSANSLGDPHYSAINNASVVLRIWDSAKSLLILGDAQYAEGDELLLSYPEYLDSDYVQMAHHGNWNCRYSFYEGINFRVALWPAPDWLWNAKRTSPEGHNTYYYRQTLSNKGITENHVSCNGDWFLPMTSDFGTEDFGKEPAKDL